MARAAGSQAKLLELGEKEGPSAPPSALGRAVADEEFPRLWPSSIGLVPTQDAEDDQDGLSWVSPKANPPVPHPEPMLRRIDVSQSNDIAYPCSRVPFHGLDDARLDRRIQFPQVLERSRRPDEAPDHRSPNSRLTSSWATSVPSSASRRASVRPPSKSSSSGSSSSGADSSERNTGSAVLLKASRTRAAVGRSRSGSESTSLCKASLAGIDPPDARRVGSASPRTFYSPEGLDGSRSLAGREGGQARRSAPTGTEDGRCAESALE